MVVQALLVGVTLQLAMRLLVEVLRLEVLLLLGAMRLVMRRPEVLLLVELLRVVMLVVVMLLVELLLLAFPQEVVPRGAMQLAAVVEVN